MHQYATLEDTVYLWFGANDTAGSGNDGASAAYDVREGGATTSAAPVLSGTPDLLTHANYPAGCYEVVIAATAANGFAANKTYGVFCTLTVSSQNPTGFIGSFRLAPIPANVTQWLGTAVATPTVAGVPEVDMTHLGGAAQSATDLKDFADDGYDPATNKVQGVVLTDTVTTYTGNTPQTGDAYARLGAPAGASVSADVAAVKSDTAAILVDTADMQPKLGTITDLGGGATVGANLSDMAGATFNASTDSQEALRDRGDAAWTTATGFSTLDAAGVRTAVGLASANLDTQLDALPTAGENADAVWDEPLAGHLAAGSTGEALNAAGAAGDPWTTVLPGAYGAGSAGNILGNRLVGTLAAGTHQPQSGDAYARLGAPAGASVSADVAAVQADTDNIQTRLPAALVAGRMDSTMQAAATGVITAAVIATDAIDADALAADAVTEMQSGLATSANQATILARLGAFTGSGVNTILGFFQALMRSDATTPSDVGGTYDDATESLQAIRARGDAAWTTATGFSTLDAAGVRTAVGLASANLDTQLDALPTNAELATALAAADDAVLAAIAALNNLSSAGAQAAAAAALAAYGAAVTGDAMTLTSGERNAVADALLDRTDGVETGVTVRGSLRLANAANGGKTDGMATSTVHLRDLADTKNRVTATVDVDGNRTAVTRDLT